MSNQPTLRKVVLVAGATTVAWVVEALLAVAVMAVVFGDNCAAANVYHLLHSRLAAPSPTSEVIRH